MAADEARVDALVGALRDSRKYRHLCDEILVWAARTALERQGGDRAALKFAKRKLHQAFGSFVGDRRRLLTHLDEAASAPDESTFRTVLAEAVRHHASTAERVDDLSAFWACVTSEVGHVDSVLDLGCGAAPATLPWSELGSDVRYHGVDLDQELNVVLERALRPRYGALAIATADVRTAEKWPHFDVAVLAKLLPTLERQETGAARRLVDRIDADVLVATFPIRSLGGQDRGMTETYTKLADAVLGPGLTTTIPGELVRIVRRSAC